MISQAALKLKDDYLPVPPHDSLSKPLKLVASTPPEQEALLPKEILCCLMATD